MPKKAYTIKWRYKGDTKLEHTRVFARSESHALEVFMHCPKMEVVEEVKQIGGFQYG